MILIQAVKILEVLVLRVYWSSGDFMHFNILRLLTCVWRHCPPYIVVALSYSMPWGSDFSRVVLWLTALILMLYQDLYSKTISTSSVEVLLFIDGHTAGRRVFQNVHIYIHDSSIHQYHKIKHFTQLNNKIGP